MSFEERVPQHARRPRLTVGRSSTKNVWFQLNAALLAQMGWQDLRSIKVEIGKGKDEGLVQISAGPGFAIWRQNSGAKRFEIAMSALPAKPPAKFRSMECPHLWGPSINGLIITLPWVESQMKPLRELFEAAA